MPRGNILAYEDACDCSKQRIFSVKHLSNILSAGDMEHQMMPLNVILKSVLPAFTCDSENK